MVCGLLSSFYSLFFTNHVKAMKITVHNNHLLITFQLNAYILILNYHVNYSGG